MINLVFTTSLLPAFATLSAIALIAGVLLARRAYVRSGKRRAAFFLEELRLLALVGLLLTLLAAELVYREPAAAKPTLLVLSDVSDSMNTRDVIDPDAGERAISRRDWLDLWRKSYPKLWERLHEKYRVRQLAFAATLSPSPDRPEDFSATDIADALEQAAAAAPDLRAMVVASDGQWNKGGDPAGETLSQRRAAIPVFTLGVGRNERLPDLRVEKVRAPAAVLTGDYVAIQCRLANYLPAAAKGELKIKARDGKVLAAAPFAVESGADGWVTAVWEPDREGDYNLEVSVPAPPGDIDPANNRKTFQVKVKREPIRLLLVDSLPRWEYRFLRNAARRDPAVDIDCLLTRPGLGPASGDGYLDRFPSKDGLDAYDAFVIGDIGLGEDGLSADDWKNLIARVRTQGGGLVLVPSLGGRLAHAVAALPELADALPVALDPAAPKGVGSEVPRALNLTFAGRESLLTRLNADKDRNEKIWRKLPPFYWRAAVVTAKGDAEVLAVSADERTDRGQIPLIASRPLGDGLILFMGIDSVWRWREGVEDLYHYRFWGQIARYVSRQRHMARSEGGRIVYAPETPERTVPLHVQAVLLDPRGLPARNAVATLRVTEPDGHSRDIRMDETPGGWGVYKADFTPMKTGAHALEAFDAAAKKTAPAKAAFHVGETTAESVGDPVNASALRELSRATGGRYAPYYGAEEFMKALIDLPKPAPETIRFQLWKDRRWLIALVALFSVYWLGRKFLGQP